MRFITLLYALYVLVLLSMPCGDAYNRCNDSAQATTEKTAHDHEDDADDSCSPFCYCACCGNYCTPLIKLVPVEDTKIIVAAISSFPLTNEFIPTGFGNHIWQPPRLS